MVGWGSAVEQWNRGRQRVGAWRSAWILPDSEKRPDRSKDTTRPNRTDGRRAESMQTEGRGKERRRRTASVGRGKGRPEMRRRNDGEPVVIVTTMTCCVGDDVIRQSDEHRNRTTVRPRDTRRNWRTVNGETYKDRGRKRKKRKKKKERTSDGGQRDWETNG